jgi:hypothetical protein
MIGTRCGVPEAHMTVVIRHLRENGLVSTSGRGISAARMTPKDVAVVLVAIGSGVQVNQMPKVVSAIFAIPTRRRLGFVRRPAQHAFGDALCALLTSADSYAKNSTVSIILDGAVGRFFATIQIDDASGLRKTFYSSEELSVEAPPWSSGETPDVLDFYDDSSGGDLFKTAIFHGRLIADLAVAIDPKTPMPLSPSVEVADDEPTMGPSMRA